MSLSTVYSCAALIRAGNKLLEQVDVVSFDLFDTLLIRRTHDPDLVKRPVATFISSLATQQGLDWGWRQVQKQRDEHENALRQHTGQEFEDYEAHYPTFMQQTLDSIFADRSDQSLLQKVTEYELKMENAMLVPRKEIVDWLVELAELGKRIFVLSDIYLPAGHLRILLEHADLLEHVESVISSADSYLAKASGRTYPMLAEKFGLVADQWLHVGDNPISDGFRPHDFGCHALVLNDPAESRRKAIAARHFFYSRYRPYWKGRALQQLMAPLEGENIERSGLYTEGYNFLGPLIGVFVQTIAERCRKTGITKVFFMSREGSMFKQYWEKAMPYLFPDDDLPEIEYLYVSRVALAGASCAYQGLTPDNAGIVFLPPGNRDFRDVCRVFGFDPALFMPHLERHELSVETTLSPLHEGFDVSHSRNFKELLKDDQFQQEIRRQSLEKNEALQRYLDDLGFYDHRDVALVDIGWLGTIQRFFFESIAHRSDKPNCHGMLFGATRGIPFKTRPDNYVEGIIYERDKFDFASSAILYARDLFEEACRAPHATLNGYKLTADGYELQFREMSDAIGQAEQEQDQHYADLQQGVIDSAERFGAASALLIDNIDGYRPWLNYLMVSKLAFPRRREIRTIRYKHHLDDFHGTSKPKFFKRPRLIHNPWEVSGWRLWLGTLFSRRLFRRHLKTMINQG